MRRLRYLLLAILALAPAPGLSQEVNRDILLPPGVYRLGRVTQVRPLTVDLTAAEGVAGGSRLTLVSKRYGTEFGGMTVTAVTETGAQGRLDDGVPTPQSNDLAAFRTAAPVPAEAPSPLFGTIERALPEPFYHTLSLPQDVQVAVGDSYPVADAEGGATTLSIKEIRGDRAKVFCVRPLKAGTRVTLPSRLLVVRGAQAGDDPLIGKTAYVRFRKYPAAEKSSYFHGKILAVDRGRADGPVPCFTAKFVTEHGAAAWTVMPADVQHVLILDHVPAVERDMALALWEKEKNEEDAPHRHWEQTARKFYLFFKSKGTLATAAQLDQLERDEQEKKTRSKSPGFDPGDLFRPYPFPVQRRPR